MSNGEDSYRDWAADYDRKSDEFNWYGPAVLFGLLFPSLNAGQTVLDAGIGTGLGSAPFRQAGLTIIGLDSSPSMLAECRKKNFADRLIEHDLTQCPWPVQRGQINHIISVGVFHFIADLRSVFTEVARLLPGDGCLGFDYCEIHSADPADYEQVEAGVYTRIDPTYNVRMVRHTPEYVEEALTHAELSILHDITWAASGADPMFFRTVVAQHE